VPAVSDSRRRHPAQAVTLAAQRFRALGLTASIGDTPAQIVHALVAVQAQDFNGAKWAIAQRLTETTDRALDHAYDAGLILRTHVLRPTWHFVTPDDLRWLLALTAPRVHAANASRYRELELDTRVFVKAERVFARELRDGRTRTRDELRGALTDAGLDVSDGGRMAYLLMHAELDARICSGPRRGKQFTYAWFDSRVSPAPALSRDEALVRLVRHYFETRGPATLHDFAKWSGLTVRDGRRGLDALRGMFETEVIDGREHWVAADGSRAPAEACVHLLSVFDECISSYRDRPALCHPDAREAVAALGAAPAYVLSADGLLTGTWKRKLAAHHVTMDVRPAVSLTHVQRTLLEAEIHRFAAFVGVPATMAMSKPA
jgi:hypothetical protein